MKLLTIAHSSGMGGANISWLNVIRGLKKLGVDIKVIISEKGLLSNELENLNISYNIIPFYYCVYPKISNITDQLFFLPKLIYHEYINLRAKKELLKIAQLFQPDIIHCNGSVVNIGLFASKKLDIPHVWHLREYTDLDFGYHLIPSKKIYFNKIRKHSYSIAITSSIFNHFSISNNMGKTIYNGIFSKEYNPCPKLKNNTFIFVGAVTENKGVTDLINAFIQYRKRGGCFPLYILGPYNSSYVDDLIRILHANSLESEVKFIGRVNNVSEYMSMANAIIVPSKNEGFGRITAEAMWHNCLVIGRNTGGTKLQFDLGNQIMNHEIGIRFNNVAELTDQLLNIEKMNIESYLTYTTSAKEVVMSQYSIEKNIKETYDYFLTLIS